MADTSIEWTDKTWNPTAGCSIVSPGCQNCYAMRAAYRLEMMGQEKYVGTTKKAAGRHVWNGKVNLDADSLDIPLKWKKPCRIFVNSMSDLFHKDIPDSFIDRVFAVMSLAQNHTFQILTKRPERMHKYLTGWPAGMGRGHHIALQRNEQGSGLATIPPTHHKSGSFSDGTGPRVKLPLPNVWLGTSVEDQERADERIPWLLKTPAAVRFLSCEPLLGPVDLGLRNWAEIERDDCRLNWVIAGGESGPSCRPCDLAWVRLIVEDCKAAKVPVFVKQLGGWPVIKDEEFGTLGILDYPVSTIEPCGHKGEDISRWPEDLRIQQFPNQTPSTL